MESGRSSERKDQEKSTLRLSHRNKLSGIGLDMDLGKLPPQALDLEEAVLGALMLEKDALTTVIDILKPDHFYKEGHQAIYDSITDLFKEGEPVDLLTVTNQLRKKGKLEFVGGAYYITALTTRVNSAANIEYHARIIVEQAIKRELIRIASVIHKDAYEDSTDVFDLLADTERQMFEITDSNSRKSYEQVNSILQSALKEIETRKEHKDGLTGVPSGLTALDRLTSGWQKSDLVIIAARPGMGKTAFVLSTLRNAAVDFGKPVAIFSLEMSSIQLVNRLISAEAELESEKIKKGTLEDYEWEQLIKRVDKLNEAQIFIDDTPALSILELRAKARRLKYQNGIELLIVDYLQLMTGDTRHNSGGNREQEIASISRSLKNLAKELNIPVIALSQLSRAVESRGGEKRPQLSDLRESGSIEQDADMVMFLYRPAYYGITEDEEGMPTEGMAEIIIAKHRNGSLDTVRTKFIGKFTKFADLDIDGNSSVGGLTPFSELQGGPGASDGAVIFGSKMNESTDEDEDDDGESPF